jgi:hypothetical protein
MVLVYAYGKHTVYRVQYWVPYNWRISHYKWRNISKEYLARLWFSLINLIEFINVSFLAIFFLHLQFRGLTTVPRAWDARQSFLDNVVSKSYLVIPAAVGGVIIGLILWFITIFTIRCVCGFFGQNIVCPITRCDRILKGNCVGISRDQSISEIKLLSKHCSPLSFRIFLSLTASTCRYLL